jgi:hypothetical protein
MKSAPTIIVHKVYMEEFADGTEFLLEVTAPRRVNPGLSASIPLGLGNGLFGGLRGES